MELSEDVPRVTFGVVSDRDALSHLGVPIEQFALAVQREHQRW
ncbi:hypothetical protein ACFQH2_03185 [Natronoarchaeum sp. GCM10025703]